MAFGGTLFVSENTEPGATIIALDASTGEEQWKTAYGGETSVGVYTVDRERLYISRTGNDGEVIALDSSTGEESWRTTVSQFTETPGENHKNLVPTYGWDALASCCISAGLLSTQLMGRSCGQSE